MTPELTLPAALRDAQSPRHEARNLAVRNLAPALLAACGLTAPVWWDRIDHRDRERVAAALDLACDDRDPQIAALAHIGLAQLAAPSAHERASLALEIDGQEDAAMFVRECAVIALGLVGTAARAWLARPDSAGADDHARARALRDQILGELRTLLDDPREDVRFQAAPALREVGGEAVEGELIAAFEREEHEELRENLICTLASYDPPSPATCDLLAEVLGSPAGRGPLGWEAALALAAARRAEAGPRLLEGLRQQATRDRALEALAVIGPKLNERAAAATAVRRYTRGLLVPVFTRVRAAYALARLDPAAGQGELDRLARHLRPSVREAVDEARELLAKLDDEIGSEGPPASAYRRS